MSDYTKTTNFAAKDSLPSGNSGKIVKGTEIDTEFDNIQTAIATKANIAGPTFTGTVTIPTVDLNGGAIDGTTVGASTAAAITGTTIVANTSINIAGDGATVTGIKDEDDMSSNSATKLATQQSIKAYVDSQVTAQDLDFQADSGGALSIDLDSETLTFTGGTGVDTSGSGNAVTFAIDSTVATLTGTQTLTNKTLTSPTLNTPTIGTSFTIGSATITEAELEILDGATVTTAELNVLDGITSTTAELNILDGVTSTAAELNILDGVTSTAAELNILDGVTSTAAELNILDGVTATTAELNIMDGVTATTAELNYVDGVTSNVQTQLDAKAPIASPTFTGTVTVPGLTTSADINVADNVSIRFGDATNGDLVIKHDGTNSSIVDRGDGDLLIQGSTNVKLQNFTGSKDYFVGSNGGASTVYYDGSAKLATTSTGIDVTGTVTADGLTVDGDAIIQDATPTLEFKDTDNNLIASIAGASGSLLLKADTGSGTSGESMQFHTGGVVRQHISSGGDISFYNSSGTSQSLFWDSSAESLGIGTSLPEAGLHVKSTSAGAMTTFESSSANSSGGPNIRLWRNSVSPANGDGLSRLIFQGMNSADERIDYAEIQTEIENVNDGVEDGLFQLETYVGGVSRNRLRVNGTESVFNDGGRNLNFRVESDANEHMLFVDAGNNAVGIGSSSPDYLLHLEKAGGVMAQLKATDSNQAYMKFVNSTTGDGTFTDGLLFGLDTDESAIFWNYEATATRFATAGTERLRIDSNGRVGIGVVPSTLWSSSYDALQIGLGGSIAAHDGAGHALKIGSNFVYEGIAPNYYDKYLTSSTAGKYEQDNDGHKWFTAASGTAGNAISWQERMRISDGNLLVGTTTTSSTVIGAKILPSGRLTLVTADSGTQYPVTFGRETTGAVGSITTTASATAYNTSSDQRLKENIVDAPSASDDIDAIQVRSFDWKADGSHQKYGMVAQELQSVAPESVSEGETEDDMLGVDYSKLVPMLVKEIQSLRARVAQLEN